jgi:hypothetical protein
MLRALGIALLGLSFASTSVAANVSATSLHARLLPVVGSSSATGTFDAQVSATSRVRWQLSLRNLGLGPAKATLQIGALGGPSFVLCRRCAQRARGTFVLTRSMARRFVGRGGKILVTTSSYPQGVLRGSIRRG